MKNELTRLLCLCFALCFIISSLAACGPKEGPDGGGGTEPPEQEDYDPSLSALQNALNRYSAEQLEAVKGREFTVLSPSPGSHFYHYSGTEENEVWYEEPSSETLPNAIYNRNRKTEDKLGITIKPIWGGSTDDISNTVRLNDAAGDTEFDVVLSRLDYEIGFAANGYLMNFYELETMNLKNRWWDEQVVDTFTMYGNKLYVLSGDINYYDDYAVQVTMFNKDLCDELNFEYPYNAVKDGTWTVDKMTEMAEAAKFDYNSDDVYTPGTDRLGLGDNYDAMSHFLYCYGLTMSTQNEHGEPEVAWLTDESLNAVEKIFDIFSSDYSSTDTGGNATTFMNGKLLFYCEMLGVLPMYKEMENDFGILPMPKGSADMDRYNAYVSNGWSTVYCIPKAFSHEEGNNIGLILECLSAASMDEVTPALYDQLLESRYIRDPESKEMLTYILDSKLYDLAGDLSWATALRSAYQNALTNGPSSLNTALSAGKKSITKSLQSFCDSIKNLPTTAPSAGGAGPADDVTEPPETEPPTPAAAYKVGDKIEGEDFDEKQGSVQAEMLASGEGMNLGYVAAGDWVLFKGVDLTGAATMTGCLAGSGILVEIRIDAPDGDVIAATTADMTTGSWSVYDEFTVELTEKVEGLHDVYFCFVNGSINLDWFMFGAE